MAKKTTVETEFKAQTDDFQKGIKEADKSLKTLKNELKLNSSQLKENSDNIDLVHKRHDILQKESDETSKKIENLEQKLKIATNLFGENSQEVYNLNNEIIKAQTQFQNIQNELIKTDNDIENLTRSSDELEEEFEDVEESTKDASDGFTIMKGIIADLASNAIQSAMQSLKAFSREMISTAASVVAENSAFSQTFGEFEDEATKAVKRVAESTGILDTRLKQSAAQIYAFARSSGASVPEALELMETALNAAADDAAYYDKVLENSTDTLQSFLKGNFANDAALGVSCTETTRNAKAMELFGKKYNDLSEIQKQQTLMRMVTDSQKLSGAMGQASREADGWENVTGNLKETWRQFQATVGTPILEELIPIIQEIQQIFQNIVEKIDWDKFGEIIKTSFGLLKSTCKWFVDNSTAILTVITGIVAGVSAYLAYTTAIKVMKEGWMALTVVQKTAAAVQWALNAAQSANPIGLIISAILGLIAVFVTLWKKCDWFREFWINLWNNIKKICVDVWKKISSFFKESWNDISSIFIEAINGIKNIWISIIDWFKEKIIEPLKKVFQPIFNWYMQLYNGIFQFFVSIGKVLIELIIGVINSIKLIFAPLENWFNENVIQPICTFFVGMWNFIKEMAQNAWNFIKEIWAIVSNWFNETVIQPVADFFKGMWNMVETGAKNTWTGIKNIFSSVANFFGNIFSDAWTRVKNVFSKGGKVFEGIKDGILSSFKNVVNGLIDGINNVVSIPFKGINKALSNIKNVNIFGQKPFAGLVDEISIPQIPRLKVGLDYVPRDFFPAFLDEGERVLTKQENSLFNSLGGFEGILLSRLNNNNSKAFENNQQLAKLIELQEKALSKEWKFEVNDREMAKATRNSNDLESADLINLKKRGLVL